MIPTQSDFNSALIESVDETMQTLFSREVVIALHFNLETRHAIFRENIPNAVHTLKLTLQENFGMSAPTIGRAIARKLYSKLHLESDSKQDYGLPEYVEEAKKRLSLLGKQKAFPPPRAPQPNTSTAFHQP